MPSALQTGTPLPRWRLPAFLFSIIGGSRESSEAAARLIHAKSRRSEGPFVMVRCGLYRGPLLDKRFFGRVGSAPAHFRNIGRQAAQIELADQGTLYIDQIQHATPLMQEGLLQALDEEVFVDPVTGVSCRSDVRIIASSSMPLEACCQTGRLHPKLMAHLGVMTLRLATGEARQFSPGAALPIAV